MEMASVRRRVGELRIEQANLGAALATLERELSGLEKVAHRSPFESATVTNASPASAKVALFRDLFKGRSDVFPLRWENRKLARAGYSPACSNEWVRGICAKPRHRGDTRRPPRTRSAAARQVLVVDYVDGAVPVLARMAVRRRAGYRGLGYLLE